jgi:hypothetical protein
MTRKRRAWERLFLALATAFQSFSMNEKRPLHAAAEQQQVLSPKVRPPVVTRLATLGKYYPMRSVIRL